MMSNITGVEEVIHMPLRCGMSSKEEAYQWARFLQNSMRAWLPLRIVRYSREVKGTAYMIVLVIERDENGCCRGYRRMGEAMGEGEEHTNQ